MSVLGYIKLDSLHTVLLLLNMRQKPNAIFIISSGLGLLEQYTDKDMDCMQD